MEQDPKHISEILPQAAEALARGEASVDPSIEERDQRDRREVETELKREIEYLNARLGSGNATDEERRLYDEKRIELLALRQEDGIEPAD